MGASRLAGLRLLGLTPCRSCCDSANSFNYLFDTLFFPSPSAFLLFLPLFTIAKLFDITIYQD
jgi:hypothetical protein